MRMTPILLMLFVISCNDKKPPIPRDPRMLGPFASAIRAHEKYVPPPTARDLDRTTLHPGELVIRDSFNAADVLLQLFPGNLSHEPDFFEEDTVDLIWWTCADCEPIPYKYAFWYTEEYSEDFLFPDTAWNTTMLLNEAHFDIGDQEYIALIFFHSAQIIPEFCGRFSGAPTGMALFRKHGSTYTLENFTAVFNSYGSFSQPIYPEFLFPGQNSLVIDFTTYNGGAGGEYTEVKELFIPHGKGFKKVLREEFLSCVNTWRGEWRTTVRAADTTREMGYSDLIFTTSGDFHGKYFYDSSDYDWLFNDAPGAFKSAAYKAIANHRSISFTLTRTYRYNGSEYTLVKSVMDSRRMRTPKEEYQPAWVLE